MNSTARPLFTRFETRFLTTGSLVGLCLGLAVGAIVHAIAAPSLDGIVAVIAPVGTLWTNALRMTVIPLVVSVLIVAITSSADARTVGRLGGLSLLTFIAMLVLAGVFTVVLTPPLLQWLTVDAATGAALGGATAEAAQAAAASRDVSISAWFLGIFPTNPIRAAAQDDILGLVVFTVLFALAITRAAAEHRDVLVRFFQAVAHVMFVLIRWVLLVTPFGVFALALDLAARTGLAAAGALGYFVVLVSGLMLVFTALLYPVTVIAARVPLRRFARASAPAQAVAISTRSSLASLPALLDGAENRLGLPSRVGGFVLPLAVSTFKVNRTISSPAKMLFLAALYGVPIDPGTIGMFVGLVVLLSFTSPGIPSGGFLITLPVYLSVGIPIEGVILLNTVDAIPDIFKTLLNVTADMSAAAVVNRVSGGGLAVAVPERVAGLEGAAAAVEAGTPG